MPIPYANLGDIMDVRPLGAAAGSSKTTTLVKTADLALIRLVIHAGKELPTHKAPGEITVQCLGGRVAFTIERKTQELTTGQLFYLTAREPHAVKGIEDSALLVTILSSKVKSDGL